MRKLLLHQIQTVSHLQSENSCWTCQVLVASKMKAFKVWFTRYWITFHERSLSWIRYKKRSGAWVFTLSLKNSPVTQFRAKIISLRLSYLFSLPICQAIIQPHLHWSYPVIKARVGSVSYRITMFFIRETKRYRLYPIHFRATCWCVAKLYRIVGAERIWVMKSCINTTLIRYEKGFDT